MKKIYGTEFLRRKARMSLRVLSERSGVSTAVLRKLCKGEPPMSTPLMIYMRVSEAFEVPIADLLREHSESELDAGDHTAYPSRTDGQQNCVAVYRRVKGLTLEQLAQLLGSSNRQCAQLACAGEKAGRKHVRLLAAHEGISPEEFRQIYAPDKEVA